MEYAPFQEVGRQFPEISEQQFHSSVQLIEPDGRIYSGAEAVFRTLERAPAFAWALWAYRRIPGMAPLANWGYRFIARHRSGLGGAESYLLTRTLFLRGLALVYGIAFASLWTQIQGLIGSKGILPAADFMNTVLPLLGADSYWGIPSLLWLNSSDVALHLICGLGVACSLLLAIGRAPAPMLFLLWALYLSLAAVSQDFLNFQWDALLLEAGFLAIFFAPGSKLVLWLFRWLLFRLMFSSGMVKLLSGDLSWRGLTALTFHYETQPLPTWIGWYAHQLPVGFQKFCAGGMFAIELAVPFLIFGPRWMRRAAFWIFIAFQGLIAATGNYGFFTLLIGLLCFLLLEDAAWPGWLRARFSMPPNRSVSQGLLGKAAIPLAGLLLFLSGSQLAGMLIRQGSLPRGVVELSEALAPFRMVNSYGLFAVMTTRRPEILLEGSRDGLSWEAYEFHHKPGDLGRRPGFVAPRHPRLDWQMWFAALSGPMGNPWFFSLMKRLLEGSPPVLNLLKENPFPEKPPLQVRAILYEYHFTTPAQRRATGNWWRREYKGLYCPVLSLKRKEETS